jgi:DNA-binding beta-propeller fold protein YncE
MKGQLYRIGVCFVAVTTPFCFASAALIGNNASLPNIYDVSTTTGAATNPRSTGTSSTLTGITYDPFAGILYGLTALDGNFPNSLVKINPTTGALVVVGSTHLSRIFEGDIAFNPVNGHLYGIVENPDPNSLVLRLFQINPATGAATVVGPMNTAAQTRDFSALAFNAAGTLFTIDTSDSATLGHSVLSTVDPNTASLLSSITMNVNLGETAGLAFDPATGIAYVADGAFDGTLKLYTLNTATGVATAVGNLGDSGGLAGLAFTTPVPEPAICTMLFVSLVLGGLVHLHRRKHRSV